MAKLSGAQIRQKFLDFYAAKAHQVLPSASLVPEDPTVLLTIAGMLPFKPIFLGQKPAEYPRATTSQKCIRTNDIENVGKTARHHTFFEMLGNFSFGDYFKEQAIAWAWELSTEVYNLPPDRIIPSVFEADDEAFAIWRDKIGIPAHRIQRMGAKDNFWAAGPTGPCGPCSELYYDFHPELGDDKIDLEDDSRFIEYYNLVFMESNRDADGKLTPLEHQNIDTGLGLERLAQILQGVPNNYETDLILPIMETVAKIAGIKYEKSDEKTKTSLKVIGDHIRAVVHLIADGVTASNTDRGYVLRRLIRRVVRHGRLIGIEGAFTTQVAESAIALSESAFPNVRERESAIKSELEREENQFLTTLERGEKLFSEIAQEKKKKHKDRESIELVQNSGQELKEQIQGESIPDHIKNDLGFSSLLEMLSNIGTPFSEEKPEEYFTDLRRILSFKEILQQENPNHPLMPKLSSVEGLITGMTQISGSDVFKLYDTHGFPPELTQEMAEENGLSIDFEDFEKEMAKQRDRSRDAHETIDLTVQGTLDQLAEHIHPTEFVGYTEPSATATVKALLVAGKPVEQAEAGAQVQIALDQTPFYAESGGQIGDRGYLSGSDVLVRIEDVQKESSIFIHYGRIERGSLKAGDQVTAQIDLACRCRVQAHHTTTHLLQAALKNLIDDNIGQAGSLVSFDRLRFDFNYAQPLTAKELQAVEEQINTWIAEAHATNISVMPIADAKAKGAVAMFGEKYGAEVRVMDVPGVSMELCGGTHVNNTAEIGLFKIVSEAGVSSGVRRIEAIAGPAVLAYLNVRDAVVRELSDRFKAKPEELPERVTNLQAELKSAQKQLEQLKAELAVTQSDQLVGQAESVGSFKVLVAQLEGVDPEALKTAAERLLQKLGEGAVVLGSVPEAEKVSLVAAFSPGVIKQGLQAGKFVGAIAKQCGGGGGGRPNLAQAGGRDPSKLDAALIEARQELTDALG